MGIFLSLIDKNTHSLSLWSFLLCNHIQLPKLILSLSHFAHSMSLSSLSPPTETQMFPGSLSLGTSVTRLGDFWKFLRTTILTKIAQLFEDFLGRFEKENF